MKAAVCYESGKPLVVEDIEIDPPKKGEVKVRLAATAICHSDIHFLKGELRGKVPAVAGHECAGYIEEVGEGVTALKPGDPVVMTLISSCGYCRYCTSGLPQLCVTQMPLSMESRLHKANGQVVWNMARVGGFAEYAVVDQSQVVKIPGDMPMDRASLLGCGVITGFGSVVNRARVRPLESVVVIGTGGVGLNAIQGAAYSGAYPVIAVDILDNKLEAARVFGATHTVNSQKEDPIEGVKRLTSGEGADYVFVTVGSVPAMRQGFDMACRRGMIVLVGLTGGKEQLSFLPVEFIHSEKVLTGCNMGATRIKVDVPKLVSLYRAGKLKLDELITARYPLEKINEAIAEVEKGNALRNVIVFK
jgi:S-(hydroxymethyl)glutathione dehydrogenase / alcohol dehydrogenase